MDVEHSERLLAGFLHTAQQRGEASVARARLVACLAFMAMHLPLRAQLLTVGDLKSWLIISGLSLGIVFSLLGLRWSAAGTVSRLRLDLSVAIDALVVYVTLGSGVMWPHATYVGVVREPELAIVYLAIVGAGIRLSRRGALFAAVLHGVGLVALLTMDELHNAARLVYTPMEVVFVAAFFAVAAMVGHSIAHRTRALVLQGASAAVLAERARQRLGVYVSEEVASSAMAGELALGGSNKQAAVLFSDLRGFTRYAEGLAPERLVDELNAYLHEMVAEIRAEGGVVDKYIGDAIMAVFGVPSGRPDDAARAIRAADRMRVALARHNRDREARGLPPLAHGVGVHYGPMVAGNIGTAERMQYTVIGDAVNLASRLESATKDTNVELLVSDTAVHAALAAGGSVPALRVHGTIAVRGHEAVLVHTLA